MKNILFIMTDQQRFDQMGYTNPAVKTPNLDHLAEESIFFRNAFTSNPVCVPARAAIFTGRYPSQTGVPHNGQCLPKSEHTFMSMLRNAGYHTAVIGKQHFNGSPIEHGYDYEDIIDTHAPPKTIDPYNTGNPRLDNSYLRFLYDNGFRHGEELFEPIDTILNRWKADTAFYVDHYVGERGKEWLQSQRPEEAPWFFCLSFLGPHGPVDGVGLPHEELYSLEGIDLPHTDMETLLAKPDHFKGGKDVGWPSTKKQMSADYIRRIRRAWYANMSLIDEKIGEILDVLRNSGEYDDTMIVFTSDHGDFTCDFNRVDKGQFLVDVLMHIPLFIKPPWPGEGHEESSFVSSIDLPATFLQTAGVTQPSNMASQDLSPYLRSENDVNDRQKVYMEAHDLRGLRTPERKFIYYQHSDEGEFYDIQNDPWETTNLWDEPAYQDEKNAFNIMLLDQLISLSEGANIPWNQ